MVGVREGCNNNPCARPSIYISPAVVVDEESRAAGVEQCQGVLLTQRGDGVSRGAVYPCRAHIYTHLFGEGRGGY